MLSVSLGSVLTASLLESATIHCVLSTYLTTAVPAHPPGSFAHRTVVRTDTLAVDCPVTIPLAEENK